MTLNEIEQIVKYCCNELHLPEPKIKILDDAFGVGSCSYENGKCTISLVPHRMNVDKQWEYDSIWKFVNHKPRYKWEYSFMIIAHELAHYMQYKRHWMWLATYAPQIDEYLKKKKRFSLQKYNSLKVEANANKVALILLKRAKKNKFKLDKS